MNSFHPNIIWKTGVTWPFINWIFWQQNSKIGYIGQYTWPQCVCMLLQITVGAYIATGMKCMILWRKNHSHICEEQYHSKPKEKKSSTSFPHFIVDQLSIKRMYVRCTQIGKWKDSYGHQWKKVFWTLMEKSDLSISGKRSFGYQWKMSFVIKRRGSFGHLCKKAISSNMEKGHLGIYGEIVIWE